MLGVRGVSRSFGSGDTVVHALRDVSFEVAPGTMVALVGRSGSGKTTLLNVVGGLDRSDAGTVEVDGTDVTALNEDGLSALRQYHRDVTTRLEQVKLSAYQEGTRLARCLRQLTGAVPHLLQHGRKCVGRP